MGALERSTLVGFGVGMRRLFLIVTALAVAGCLDPSPTPGPGTITATVVGPNGAEGAAVLVLLESGVTNVVGVGDTEAFSESTGDATQIVLINETGGALTFTATVSDVSLPPAHVVQQVAGPDDELRSDVTAYSLEYALEGER